MAVLWGERDTLIPSSHGRNLVEKLHGAVFTLFPNCGHYVYQEQPDEFVSVVRAFLGAAEATPVTLVDSATPHGRSKDTA